MDFGSWPQWAGFGLVICTTAAGQVVMFVKFKTHVLDRLKRLEDDTMETKQCLASIKKQSMNFLPIADHKEHQRECKAERLRETESLRADLSGMRTDVHMTKSMVQQLLAIKTGEVR